MDKNQYEEILQRIEKSDYNLKLKGVSVAVLDKIEEYGDDYSNIFTYEDVTQMAKELLQTDEVFLKFNEQLENHIVKRIDDYEYEMSLSYGIPDKNSSVRETLEAKRVQKNNNNAFHPADELNRQESKQPEIRTVVTNIGEIPIEDYREMVAMQWGYDSYAEMYNEGFRIGNGYDINPTGTDAHTKMNNDFIER